MMVILMMRWLVMPPGCCNTLAIRGMTLLPRGPSGTDGFSMTSGYPTWATSNWPTWPSRISSWIRSWQGGSAHLCT
eukprot:5796705-Karenia_brevis.AAC.1